MQLIGDLLKNSREAKKIDIRSASNDLNISQYLINKIESNEFSFEANKAYLIGHLRVYAKYLELDSDEVVKMFKLQVSSDNKNLLQVMPKPFVADNFFFTSRNISFVSIIAISFAFYFLFIKSNDLYPNYSVIPDLPENLQSELEEVEMKIALYNIDKIESKISNQNNEERMIIELNTNVLNNNFISSGSSVVASLPTKNDKTELENKITLQFIGPTWIQIHNDRNQTIISKLMNKNDEYTYFVADNYLLTTGNAGNILFLINGEPMGKVGKKGEVIDSLSIDSEFNN